MKKFLIMILFILLLTGCSKRTEITDSQDSQEANMFICIQESDLNQYYDVVYHKDTKVMYAVSHGGYNSGNFTLLVNPDGTPMLYEADEEGSDTE